MTLQYDYSHTKNSQRENKKETYVPLRGSSIN